MKSEEQGGTFVQKWASNGKLGPVRSDYLIGPDVFPGELAFHPDIGPPLAAVRFMGAALEGVPGALRIDGRRLGLAEQLAQVQELLLRGRALGELGLLPLGNEFLRRHEDRRSRVGCIFLKGNSSGRVPISLA